MSGMLDVKCRNLDSGDSTWESQICPTELTWSRCTAVPTNTGFPPEAVESTLQDRFIEIVGGFPQRVAVADGDGQLTYVELARAAGGVADVLRRSGVRPEETVAV